MNVVMVLPQALPMLEGTGLNYGGMELRGWTLARGLAGLDGVFVRVLVRGDESTTIRRDGVEILTFGTELECLRDRILNVVDRREGFPWVRVKRFEPRVVGWLWRWRALKRRAGSELEKQPHAGMLRAEADHWVVMGISAYAAQGIATAKALGKPVTLMLGSDGDLDERFAAGSSWVSPYGDRGDVGHWVIMEADQVVVQTEQQRRLLMSRFGRAGIVLPNPIDVEWWKKQGSGEERLPESLSCEEKYVLWVGRCERWHKRPQLAIELARRLPQERMLMVLNPKDDALENEIRADLPENVVLISALAYEQMPALFGKAKMFVSTSALEGFPNTFLQAAVMGVPILSLEVGEEFLEASGAGMSCGGDLSEMVRLVESYGEWCHEYQAEMARDYVIAENGVSRIVEKFSHLLRQFPVNSVAEENPR